ncbi:hypothetical protein CDV36_015560 [Fusarium kuroshium]|uniref:Mitochondrial ATPase expression-domain-containing protein n=1 Tax=Fusarium kuroshium TaxID=2010991 RepID=A0A3M2R9G0_9HYPO|nr:hypothetical protein CDV36_015560 [Fusarium kuroshium]
MIWRHSLRRGPRLSQTPLTTLRTTRDPLPPARSLEPARPAVVGRPRWLATHSTSTSASMFTGRVGNWLPDETGVDNPSPLDHLLRSIQCYDHTRILPNFYEWVDSLVDNDANVTTRALQELADLPVATLSEILRWIDPVANNSKHDVAHGLNISLGHTQFTNLGKLVDNFGVRDHHRALLDAAMTLFDACQETERKLLVTDYEVFIRCAGAAGDPVAAADFFGAIGRSGLENKRTTATWDEFVKARFMIDPIYYQFDRSRVAFLARRNFRESRRRFYPKGGVKRLEKLRYSLNAHLTLPFNRLPRRPSQDTRSLYGKSKSFHGYRRHWLRSKEYGTLVNEELLCTSMIAFARGANITNLRGIVTLRGFRIKFTEKDGMTVARGGKSFREGNPREPTERILSAIVESFGCMARITTAKELLVHFSQWHKIEIPHETWSSLLNWAYVSASKPFQDQHKLMGNYATTIVKPSDIQKVWETMTSAPYNVEPTFEDYSVYIKTLIVQRKFRPALDLIRGYAVPYYRHLEQQHQDIVFDEVLQESSQPSHRRIQIETQKEHVWYHITSWFDKLLSSASACKWQRNGHFMQVVVPEIIQEFSEFFHDQVRYRTAQGHVCIKRDMSVPRFTWSRKARKTLPQDRGGPEVKALGQQGKLDISDPDFEWPQVPVMKVVEWRRTPIARVRAMGPAPESTDVNARGWWDKLEKELMT